MFAFTPICCCGIVCELSVGPPRLSRQVRSPAASDGEQNQEGTLSRHTAEQTTRSTKASGSWRILFPHLYLYRYNVIAQNDAFCISSSIRDGSIPSGPH